MQFLRKMRQTGTRVIVKVFLMANYSEDIKEDENSLKKFVFINFTN